MKLLEDRIIKDGRVLSGDILKVDSFVNHMIDVELMANLAKEFYRLFENEGITKVLTIEASGIGIACLTALNFGVPVLFAKKSKSSNVSSDSYTVDIASYTHGNVNNVSVTKDYLTENDTVLIIDDFLATGNALLGLIDICTQAGAKVAGCGVVIEKAYQAGGELVRKRCRVEALARVASMGVDGSIHFAQ